jgi:hypothetical protein
VAVRLVGAAFFLIGIAVLTDTSVIHRLTDPPFARGLITFIISVATIGLAFVLVCESFAAGSDNKFDERFRRAQEILALLICKSRILAPLSAIFVVPDYSLRGPTRLPDLLQSVSPCEHSHAKDSI